MEGRENESTQYWKARTRGVIGEGGRGEREYPAR